MGHLKLAASYLLMLAAIRDAVARPVVETHATQPAPPRKVAVDDAPLTGDSVSYGTCAAMAHVGEAPRPRDVTAPQLYAGLSRLLEERPPAVVDEPYTVREIAPNVFDVAITGCRSLSNLNDLAMQARIVPAFRDGRAIGFKLYSIRPGSSYTKLGIRNGDVLAGINGLDLTSPEKALEIYSGLRHATRFFVELERGGSPITLTYRLTRPLDETCAGSTGEP